MDELIKVKDLVINFIKGLMQPMITVFSLWLAYFLVSTNKISAEQAWVIPLVVIGYWFADKSGILDLLFSKFKGTNITSNESAVEALASVAKSQASTIANAAIDLGASVPMDKVVNPTVNTTVNTGSTSAAPTDPDPDEYLEEIS